MPPALDSAAVRRRARAGVGALVALTIGWALVMQSLGWAQTSYYAFVKALGDGTTQIDAYHWETRDKSWIDGHFYSVKAPGLSLLLTPPYMALDAVGAPALAPRAADEARRGGARQWTYRGLHVHAYGHVPERAAQIKRPTRGPGADGLGARPVRDGRALAAPPSPAAAARGRARAGARHAGRRHARRRRPWCCPSRSTCSVTRSLPCSGSPPSALVWQRARTGDPAATGSLLARAAGRPRRHDRVPAGDRRRDRRPLRGVRARGAGGSRRRACRRPGGERAACSRRASAAGSTTSSPSGR